LGFFSGAIGALWVTILGRIARRGPEPMNPRQNHDRAGEAELDTEFLLILAKAGDRAALGRLLQRYRNYIGLLIRLQGRRRSREQTGAEDLSHDIGQEIHRLIATFQGSSAREFLVWVRGMIGSILANRIRPSLEPRCRDPQLERALIDELDRSSSALDRIFMVPQSTPSQQAVRQEQAVILADALEKLPDDYREVIILRHLEGISFREVARRMGRTEDSTKKVWLRALARLRRTLEKPG
jgi:RNA polymerase sigma-70 factor (ECF subfamily)